MLEIETVELQGSLKLIQPYFCQYRKSTNIAFYFIVQAIEDHFEIEEIRSMLIN